MQGKEGFIEQSLRLLTAWMGSAEAFWYPLPGHEGLGCYGTGFGGWGVQTNQKYLGAMAALSVLGERAPLIPRAVAIQARARALAALRFSLRSHNSGDVIRPDGTQWGHTWISTLGVERMMYGVYLLMPYLSDQDRADLCRVLASESNWLLKHYHRGRVRGVAADPWNHTGKNAPESNIWNGAVLWRTAAMYPDHPDADAWRQRAHLFLMNAASVPSDADDRRVMAGKPIKVGDTWTSQDTISQKSDRGVTTIVLNSVNKLVGFETLHGLECVKMVAKVTGTIDGQGEQQGMDLLTEGDTEGTDTWYFAYKKGVFVQSVVEVTSEGTIAVSGAQNMTIPMTMDMKFVTKLIQ